MPKIKKPLTIDTAKECMKAKEHGAWVSVACAPGWRFKLCRVGTYDYQKEIKEITMSLYGMATSDYDQNEVLAMWLAEKGVTDWESPNGDKFSQANARNLFCNKEYWDSLNIALINEGQSYQNYLKTKVQADVEAIKKP